MGGAGYCGDVSLTLRPGCVTALLGPNGAGKSTLLGVIAGDVAPDEGIATLDGRSMAAWLPLELARRRAVLPQASSLDFAFSVEEVVALGRLPFAGTSAERHDTQAIRHAAALLGVETLLRRSYPTLSGGERQRVQFARVLAQLWRPEGERQARYLLLDEPTAAFDLRHRRDALTVIRRLAADGCGVLAVLHDLSLAAEVADEIVLLKDGEVVGSGPSGHILSPQNLETCFDLPVKSSRGATGRSPS